ncbi:hypothetical protein [Arcobacter sp. LA11]|uniref:hypothetical protein n=1 Tax=Arcobacter sp. LA11 TaxID=1898176 RepID=UPI0009349E20|nr:hypothetical protein [Arcobacter sp. LA11]
MNYLEVKFKEEEQEEVDTTNFISNVIKAQETLGYKIQRNSFNHEELQKLGFKFNPSTKGYGLKKEFSLDELEILAKKVNLLDKHILTHGYIELKIFDDTLYFWDKALIYEGIDTFDYCMEYHNILHFEGLNVVTKSDTINEPLLNIINYTKRYNEPSSEFITQSCVWDKKEGYKILKEFVKDIHSYIPKEKAKEFN